MKKILLFNTVLLLLTIGTKAQLNNPYNDYGAKVLEGFTFLSKEIASGNIKQYDEQMVARYLKQMPFEHSGTVEMVGKIYTTVVDKNYSLENNLKGMPYTDGFKKIILEIANAAKLKPDDFKKFLTNEVNVIMKYGLKETEKNALLTVCAAGYNFYAQLPASELQRHNNAQATLWGLNGAVIGGAIGGQVGYGIGFVVGWTLGWLFGSDK